MNRTKDRKPTSRKVNQPWEKAGWWGSPLRHGSYWKEWNILKLSESCWENQNPKPPKGLLDEESGKQEKGATKNVKEVTRGALQPLKLRKDWEHKRNGGG